MTRAAAAPTVKTIHHHSGNHIPFSPRRTQTLRRVQISAERGQHPGDAEICKSLAEAIYVAMFAKQDVNGLKQLDDLIEQEKKSIEREGDWNARHETDKTLGNIWHPRKERSGSP